MFNIVFEGPDGVGKSTHLEMLAAWLQMQRVSVEVFRFPSVRTKFGIQARKMLLDEETSAEFGLNAYMLADMKACRHEVRDSTATIRLIDRYADSYVVYNSVRNMLRLRNAGERFCKDHVKSFMQLARVEVNAIAETPTLTFNLYASREVATCRREERNEVKQSTESEEFQYWVRYAYKLLKYSPKDTPYIYLNTEDQKEYVQDRVRALVKKRLLAPLRSVDSVTK